MSTSVFSMPNISLFGAGCLEDIGTQAVRLGGKKYLIVTDDFLAGSGLAGRIGGILEKAGIPTALYRGVKPNPTLASVDAAYRQYCDEGCEGVISIGGGSAHDCAKAVCILARNDGPLSRYVGVDMFPSRSAPMIAVNTTAGTASEITNCFIITDTDTETKLIFEGVNALADVAVNDPELTLTLPGSLTAATGMDALTHAVECYVSNISFMLTDELARVALRIIFENLPTAVAQPDSIAAREAMAYGQYIAGMAFGNGGVGLVHAVAHQLGGLYNLPHGLCNAVLLPHIIRYNSEDARAARKYAELYAMIAPENREKLDDNEAAAAFESAIIALSKRIGTCQKLQALGVREVDFEKLAGKTLMDSCSDTNPRKADKAQIVRILRAAY